MRKRAVYQGRVQGVGFRASAQRLAGAFNITGFVRNDPEGTVTLEAQGDMLEVDRFLDQVQRTLAHHIRRVEITVLDDDQRDAGTERFSIHR